MPNNYPNKPSTSSSLSSASSSSVTSWIRSKDSKQDAPDQALFSTGSIKGGGGVGRLASDEYMDVMEELGDMDLLDPDDIWDPSTLFPCDGMEDIDFDKNQNEEGEEPIYNTEQQEDEKPSEDLAMVFFEWLKSNKESISAEDLRNVKLKRSTIECAAKRLGGGKEGMEQLLKLVLEWVQNHKLQKKRMKEEGENSSLPNPNVIEPVYNNGVSSPPVCHTCFNHQTLVPQSWPLPPHNYSSSTAHYNAFTDPDQTSHHVVQVPQLQPTTYTLLGNPYPCQLYPTAGGDSAAKEARKKRMARQKKAFFS